MLLTGPAGAQKSEAARAILAAATAPTVALEFQELYASLLLLRRDAGGRYPARAARHAAYVLPLAEYLREAGISAARDREIDLVLSNSDGSPARRAYLLERLGPGATERIIDPGIDIVTARLSGPGGELSDQCRSAISRYYGRK